MMSSGFFKKAFRIFRSGGGFKLALLYLPSKFILFLAMRRYKNISDRFDLISESLVLEHNWFGVKNRVIWSYFFEKIGLDSTEKIAYLEIGSFEGLSACFFFNQFPRAEITCIDTWEGSDEHSGDLIFSEVEKSFDTNTADFSDQLVKVKSDSFDYLKSLADEAIFDVIYVDGSHYSRDVLLDAIFAFDHLKDGGLMIFDDYLWGFYKEDGDNPIWAINLFVKFYKRQLKVLYVGGQLIVRKNQGRRENY